MKRIIAFCFCLMLLAGLTACGTDELSEERMITRPAEEAAEPVAVAALAEEPETAPAAETAGTEETQEAAAVAVGNYTFDANGVELIPGDPFDPAVLPKADSVYEVPSCAIEGTDNLYNYGTFELTAFDDGEKELIYSILLTDPNITTTEGLALGDDVQKMVSLYGEGYTQQGNAYVYTGDAELLYIITQNDKVASIEYRMIT